MFYIMFFVSTIIHLDMSLNIIMDVIQNARLSLGI
jgi:hypothetical protein